MSFDIDALAAHVAKHDPARQGPAAAPQYDHLTFDALMASAKRFDARSDNFAQGKGATCRDLATKLARYGSFASAKQADFARKLIEWSQPRAPKNDAFKQPELTPRPNTWAAIQHFARVTIGRVKFSKKHEEQRWWILFGDDEQPLVGVVTAEGARGFARKIRDAGLDAAEIKAALDEIERDPLAAIKAHGIATGSCGCCGRELTDPESIRQGIGPICADKFGGGF